MGDEVVVGRGIGHDHLRVVHTLPLMPVVRPMLSCEAPDYGSGLPLTSVAHRLFLLKNDPEVIMALSLRLTSGAVSVSASVAERRRCR